MMLVRTRVDMTNDHAPSVRSSGAARFVRRGVNYLRRRLTPWTDEKWTIMRRPRRLNDAATIHNLVDRRLATFYDCEAGKPAAEQDETAGLKQELSSVAEVMRSSTGHRAERLEAMLAAATMQTTS
jgi:hypothetical protein